VLRRDQGGADVRWATDIVRVLFTDPQLFAARRLLAHADADVQAEVKAGRLQVTVKLGGKAFFGTMNLARLTARGKDFTSSCTCGEPQPCVHIVAGYLLGSANARHVRADEVLLELIGAETALAPKEATADAPPSVTEAVLTPDVRRWLRAFPRLPEGGAGETDDTLAFVLESSAVNGAVLDQISAFQVEDGRRRRVPLAELAASSVLDRRVQRACAQLLAAGAARPGRPWTAEAAGALLELAACGCLRAAGDDVELSPGLPDVANVDWERTGELCQVRIGTRHELRRVVDSSPPLYVDAQRRLGVLEGLSAAVWAWLRRAPVVPVSAAGNFQAALAAIPEAAAIVPPLPMFGIEPVAPGAFQPQLLLIGQGSTARAVLSFYYGEVQVTEPGAPTEFRQFVGGRWLVAQRDRARENQCVQRLLAAGLRQEDGVTWRFYLEAHFAEATRDGWLRLQRGLFDDLDFDENWRIVVESDFGFRRSVIEERDSAIATRRVNRRGRHRR
jgi:hypothetical protein